MESNRQMLRDLFHIADVTTGHGGRSSRMGKEWRTGKSNQRCIFSEPGDLRCLSSPTED